MSNDTEPTKEPSIEQAFAKAEDLAEGIVRNPWIRALSGCGFYAKGIVYLVIGTLAVFLSMGLHGGRIVNPTGALDAVKQLSLGIPLLVFLALGALGHGLWNVLRGIADIDDAGKGVFGVITRSLAVCIGIFYLYLSVYASRNVLYNTRSTDTDQIEKSITSILIIVPVGILIVLFLAVGFLGAAVHEFYSGISGKYKENYRLWQVTPSGRVFVTFLGIVSFVTRSVIYVFISYFFFAAVFLLDPLQVQGIDGALVTLANSKYGGILLLATGFGLVCHGILAFFEAKYRRIC